ncbi:MAG: LamG domain-containing protein [Candidatus Gorgyraea atricola]|nr:LamG domain-containing protein [Candidatus Gorgyraea atricola]
MRYKLLTKLTIITILTILTNLVYAADKGNDPVAHWRFDEGGGPTAYDEIGSNDGTLRPSTGGTNTAAGQMWTSQGKIGGALECDGTDDDVQIADSPSLSITGTELTLEAWIKPNASAGAGDIIHKDSHYSIYKNANETITYADSTVWSYSTVGSHGSTPEGQWSHVAVTRDADTVDFYINGQYIDSYSCSGSVADNANLLYIGSYAGTSSRFSGLIDDVKIYNYARTAAQILVDYNAGSAVHLGAGVDPNEGNAPVGYWPLDENTGTNAYDRSGNGNDGTINNATWVQGKHGSALSFDGDADRVNCGNNNILDITGAVTIESWVRPNSYDIHYPIFLIKQGEYYRTGLCGVGDGRVFFRIKIGGVSKQAYSSSYVPLNKWTHVVGVYDGAYMKVYLNGVLNGTPVAQTGNIDTTTNQLVLGAYDTGGSYSFDGTIDDVKLYNYARTQAQVAYDYNKGRPVAHYKFDEGTGSITHNEYSTADSGGAAPVGWWRMDEGTGGTTADESGNGNTATLYPQSTGTNTTTAQMWDQTGKIGPDCLEFDGTNDYVSIPRITALDGDELWTFSFWIKPTFDDGWEYYAYQTNTDGNRQFAIRLISGNNDQLSVELNMTGGNSLTSNDGQIQESVWQMITVVRDSNNFRLYYNGIEVDDRDSYSMGSGTSAFELGRGVGGGLYAPGLIDDVRIYDYARTAEQIYNDYKSTHGTMVADTKYVDGKIGKALEFDGTGDYIPTIPLGTLNAPFTVEAWGYFNNASQPNGNYDYILMIGTGANMVSISRAAGDAPDGANEYYSYTENGVKDGPTIPGQEWVHIAAVWDDSTPYHTVYLNGVSQTVDQPSAAINTNGNLVIGRYDSAGSHYMDGKLDDMRIYNYARTDAQIKSDYNAGTIFHPGGGTGEKDPWSGDLPVGHWKMDENTGVLARDASENGNDGTLGGDGAGTDVPTWTQGKHGPGLDFGGDGDYVNINSFDCGTTHTISLWMNPSNYNVVLGEASGRYSHYFSASSTYYRPGDTYVSVSYALPLSEWTHQVMVRSGTSVTFYANGSKIGTTQTLTESDAFVLNFIGKENDGGGEQYAYQGILDDVRVYDYAMTQAQVAWLYNKGKPMAHYRFNEASGTDAWDETTNNNATITIGATAPQTTIAAARTAGATGKFGRCLSLDGVDDYASLPGTFTMTDYSVSFWFNMDASSGWRTFLGYSSGTSWEFNLQNDDKVNVYTCSQLTSTSALVDGQWYHIAVTHTASGTKLYIDGVFNNENATSNGALTGQALQIGRWATAQYLKGQLDDFRIYNYERTAGQVMQDFNNGAAGRLGD